VRLTWVSAFLLLGACVAAPAMDDDDATSESTPPLDDDDAADDDDSTGVPFDPVAYHPALEGLPCAAQQECADDGPHIEGTCCTYGDNLVATATGQAAEAVDVDVSPDGQYVALCGGFGVRVNRLDGPGEPTAHASATSRCQRAAWGESSEAGHVLYLAHHGDSWVDTPFLQTWRIQPDGQAVQLDSIGEALFEGLTWRDGFLYAATHAGGLHIYAAAGEAAPSFIKTVDGFDNAFKSALSDDGDRLYVIDDELLRVVDVSIPAEAELVGVVELRSRGRDVHVRADRAYVALGGQGVDVFDLASPDTPVRLQTIALDGSAQAVHADGDLLAVAAWRYVALYDTRTLSLVATEEVRGAGEFEQDFGVDLRNGWLYVAEWERLHVLRWRPGYVAPDLWLTNEIFDLPVGEGGARLTRVVNRGPLPLQVRDIATSIPALSVSATSLDVEPGEQVDLELTYNPPADPGPEQITFTSNDVDPGQSVGAVTVRLADSARVDVGEPLGPEWGFLDPTGAGDVENLRGKVVFLAYFALF